MMASPHESSGIYAADAPYLLTIDDELATRPVWELRSRSDRDIYVCNPSPAVQVMAWETGGQLRIWVNGGYGPLTSSQRGMLQRALNGDGLPKGGG
jgi:hypothetical protein